MTENTDDGNTNDLQVNPNVKSRAGFFSRMKAGLSSNLLEKIDKKLILITSILIRFFILILILSVSVLLYKELTDKSYQIREIKLPQKFIDKGYHGASLAKNLELSIKSVIGQAHLTWSQNEIDEYNQLANQSQVQLEVGGFGVDPQMIVRYVKRIAGIPSKDIICDVIENENNLELLISVNGKVARVKVERNGNEDEVLRKLINKAAIRILRETNPLIAGVAHYGNFTFGDFEK